MSAILAFLHSPSCLQLVMVLLHSLWQGTALAVALWLLLRALPAKSVNRRYAASLVFLVMLPLAMACTWSILAAPPAPNHVLVSPVVAHEQSSAVTVAPSAPLGMPFSAPAQESLLSWPALATILWLIGASLMLVRAALSVAGAHRLTCRCTPVSEPKILSALEDVCRRVNLRRRIRLLAGKVSSPAAVGLIWPSVLLPGDLLAGLPPGQLHLILAHEIAHIRRYDYAVNLLQMILEALLFFNPAVYWMNRQIRREREAACDALAVQATGEPEEYARLLLVEATRVRNAALVSFSGDSEKPLSERVRRLLSGTYHPHSALPVLTFLSAFATGLLCLALLCAGTSWAVAEVLTPKQRMEKLDEAHKTYVKAPPNWQTAPRVRVAGTVATEDGSSLRGNLWVRIDSRSPWLSAGDSAIIKDGKFDASEPAGVISILMDVDGYAPLAFGPRNVLPNEEWAGIAAVLRRGFEARVRFVDEEGHGIPDAWVMAETAARDATIRQRHLKSDANGMIRLDHSSVDFSIVLSVIAPGFQHEKIEQKMRPEELLVVRLERAAPASGVVIDRDSKLPLPNAEVSIVVDSEGSVAYPLACEPGDGSPEGIVHADQNGRFTLSSLRDDRAYTLFVRAQGHAPSFLVDVRAGQKDLRVPLGPPLYVKGRVIGPLDQLHHDKGGVELAYNYAYCIWYGSRRNRETSSPHTVPLDIRDGVGYFEITGLWEGTVDIHAGKRDVHLDVSKPIDDVVVDLGTPAEKPAPVAALPPVTRSVLIRLLASKEAPPSGMVYLFVSGGGLHDSREMALNGCEARIDVPVPCELRIWSGKLIGYWFESQTKECAATPRDELLWEIPVQPAGAFAGRVLDADARPVFNAEVNLVTTLRPPDVHYLNSVNGARTGPDGAFMLTPVPFGKPYILVAERDCQLAATKEVTLDAMAPLHQEDLVFPRGVKLRGHVLLPDGTPAARTLVELLYTTSWSPSRATGIVRTDQLGYFEMNGVSSALAVKSYLAVLPERMYRSCKVEITVNERDHAVTLQRGATLRGVVIDQESGKPADDISVKASNPDELFGYVYADEPTNARGEFMFTRLARAPYSLSVDDGRASGTATAEGGQTEPVTIKIHRYR